MILIDNTVLSNFALVQRSEFIRLAFVEAIGTTECVFEELTRGVTLGRVPECHWEWLQKVRMTDDKVTKEEVNAYAPEWIISYNYKYLIPKTIIDAVNGNVINLHISLLPYNRGAYPNVWSFLEETPKGVTIHS